MDAIELMSALGNTNVAAFLKMIRYGEGTSDTHGYRRMFGGTLFTDFTDHPRQSQTASFKSGQTRTSTAAGAYQFLAKTWDALVAQYGFTDFSPKNQDFGAVALIAGRGALDDVVAGRFDAAVAKCCKEWASLPGSPYGQPTVTLAKVRELYAAAGGSFTDVALGAPAAPVFEDLASTTVSSIPSISTARSIQPEKTMPPFLLAALPALLDCVPKLATIFGSGTEVADRNIKAVQLAVDVAKTAAGAANEQALVESLKDPAVAATVKAAVENVWFELTQNVDGIPAARVANSAGGEFWKQPAIYVTGLLMPLVYFTVWRVLTGEFSAEVQSMVIASMVSGVLSAVTGFWLGTSFSSARKTELAAKA